MSAAKIAASLRSTGWTGTLGSSPSEYSETCNRCATFQVQIVTVAHPRPDGPLSRRSGYRGAVMGRTPDGSIAAPRTAGIGALRPGRTAGRSSQVAPILPFAQVKRTPRPGGKRSPMSAGYWTLICKRLCRPNKDFGHARLSRAVARIVKEHEFGAAPHLTQPPSDIRWPGDIKASMDEYHRDVRKLRRPAYEIDAVHPAVVTPVVGHDARERQPEPGVLVASRRSLAGAERHVGRFPCAPVAGGLLTYPRIGTGEEASVGVSKIAIAIGHGDSVPKACPGLRKEPTHLARDPVEFLPGVGGDAKEDRFADPIWMHLSVRQAQRHAPRAAEQQPLFDSSQLSELLDVS
jgi:hypothetical protein